MTTRIPLSHSKFAIIDTEDAECLSEYCWFLRQAPTTCYAVGEKWKNGRRECARMHRLILNAKNGQIIDHINHDGLDNRKGNLRFCSKEQNGQNSRIIRKGKSHSRFKGVTRSKTGKWQAQIKVNKKLVYLGIFDCEQEAAIAYNRMAAEAFGKFAFLNPV